MTDKIRQAVVAMAKDARNKGVLYQWGGEYGNPKCWGTDCGGLVIGIWKKLGLVPPSYDDTAQGLRHRFPVVEVPRGGDLCFYGAQTKASHVTIFIGYDSAQRPMCIGANGGNHFCTTKAAAWLKRAYVRRVPVHYRKDFLGYGSIDGLG